MRSGIAGLIFVCVLTLALNSLIPASVRAEEDSASKGANTRIDAEVEDTGPTHEIKQTVDKIIVQLRSIGSTSEWRDNVTALVREKFNFEVMSQGVLGPYWHRVSDEERERFIELFALLLEETYIGRVREYTDEEIRFGNEQIREGRAMVDTYVAMESGDEIPISYKMLQRNDEWQVYDVVIEEVSLVRNYRSSYSSVLRKKDIGGLLEEMQSKIEELKQRQAEEDGKE
ncbi:MAG: ABC transporter substrate-binding protein [Desulfuromonadaceae bacterium]